MVSQFSGHRETNRFEENSPQETTCMPSNIAKMLSKSSETTANDHGLKIHSAEESQSDLVEHFLQVAELIEEHLTSQFSQIGLNAVRFQVLQFVEASSPEGCSQAELAAEIGQSESSVSTLIERMRQDQLLLRLKSETDRRKKVLKLTVEGEQLLAQANISYVARMDGLVNRLNIDQQQSLFEVLEFLEQEIVASAKKKSLPLTSDGINTTRHAA